MLQVQGFGHVMHECPPKDKDLYPKGEKVLRDTFESDDEGSEDFLNELYFMAIEEEKEETLEKPLRSSMLKLYA